MDAEQIVRSAAWLAERGDNIDAEPVWLVHRYGVYQSCLLIRDGRVYGSPDNPRWRGGRSRLARRSWLNRRGGRDEFGLLAQEPLPWAYLKTKARL